MFNPTLMSQPSKQPLTYAGQLPERKIPARPPQIRFTGNNNISGGSSKIISTLKALWNALGNLFVSKASPQIVQNEIDGLADQRIEAEKNRDEIVGTYKQELERLEKLKAQFKKEENEAFAADKALAEEQNLDAATRASLEALAAKELEDVTKLEATIKTQEETVNRLKLQAEAADSRLQEIMTQLVQYKDQLRELLQKNKEAAQNEKFVELDRKLQNMQANTGGNSAVAKAAEEINKKYHTSQAAAERVGGTAQEIIARNKAKAVMDKRANADALARLRERRQAAEAAKSGGNAVAEATEK